MNALPAALDTRIARAVLLGAGVLSLFVAVTVTDVALVSLLHPAPARGPASAPKNSRRAPAVRSLEDYRVIWETRTGVWTPPLPASSPPLAPPPVSPAPVPVAPDLLLRFEAIGVSTGAPGVAILRDRAAGAQYALAVGDDLPDGTGRLAKVEKDRVTIDTPAGPVFLCLAGQPAALGAAGEIACVREDFLAASRWSESGGELEVADPCASALETGDHILAVNGCRVESLADLERVVLTGPTEILLLRRERTVNIVLRLGS